MTRNAQEVFNQSQQPEVKFFTLTLEQGESLWQPVVNGNWNRTLKPLEATMIGTSNNQSELSNAGNPSTQIIRNDLEVDEDKWILDFEAAIYVFTGAAIAGPGITGELSILYVNPQGKADLNPFYDETLTTASGTNWFHFMFPPKQMQKLLAKGGKLQIVFTVTANYAAASTTLIVAVTRTDGFLSYLKFVFNSNVTSKDFEYQSEKLPT